MRARGCRGYATAVRPAEPRSAGAENADFQLPPGRAAATRPRMERLPVSAGRCQVGVGRQVRPSVCLPVRKAVSPLETSSGSGTILGTGRSRGRSAETGEPRRLNHKSLAASRCFQVNCRLWRRSEGEAAVPASVGAEDSPNRVATKAEARQ